MKTIQRGHIEWLHRKYLPDAVLLESLSCSPAWIERDIEDAMQHGNGRLVFSGTYVAGMLIYNLVPRGFVLRRLCVRPIFRRAGVGSQLLGTLLAHLGRGRDFIRADVPEELLGMQLFLRSHGFRCVGWDESRTVLKFVLTVKDVKELIK